MSALPIEDPSKFQTKYRLLEVAAQQIALHGFEGASLRRIAEEAGVTAAAIYRHYPGGKSDLYESTLGLVSTAVSAFVRDGQGVGANVVEQVVTQSDLMWEFFSAYPSVASMVVRENIAGGPQGPSPYLDQHVEVIANIRAFLEAAIEKREVHPMNVSAFIFWVTTYVTNFHGCGALREATWTVEDLKNAREDFLDQVRGRLGVDNGDEE
jgi:AcrR family transcriptional regulator